MCSWSARAKPLFLRTVYQLLFRTSKKKKKKKKKKEKPKQKEFKNMYLSVEIHFQILRLIANPKSGF